MITKRTISTLTLCGVLLAGCNTNTETKQADQQKHTQQDKQSYNRIISLMPSNTEILYELGLKNKIVGVSTVDDYPKNVTSKQKFDAMNLNKEALLKAKPDLILAHESQKATSGKLLKSLEDKGVKVKYIKDAKSIDEMYDTFTEIGKITGKEKQAQALVKETKENVKKVKADIPKDKKDRSVYMEVSAKPDMYTAGKNTFFNDMLNEIEAKNSFNNLESWAKISKEDVIKANPDVIIGTFGEPEASYQKEVAQRGGFKNIVAVKKQRIHSINADEISRPGPRIDDGLKALKEAVYDK